ncbi:TAXI family TRAP transporter solute-binding subunit [Natronorubrum sp. DTA7]|uniref:TAXI family TRAP transporter solute-binding subunit n=1 Tax=Natronorubrum sp. DTA7 TaxID=3447016 RepID=UPI003F8642A4
MTGITSGRQSRRQYLIGAAAVGTASIAGCMGNNGAESWVMGTSEQGTSSFSIGQALQSVLRNNSDQVEVSAQASDGQVANARQLGDTYDIALLSNNIHYDSLEERGPFADEAPDNPAYLGFSTTSSECFMVTRADSDIETYDDLVGETITTFGSGSALYQLTATIFEELGIYDDYDYRDIPLSDFGSALDEGRIDACGAYTTLLGTSMSGGMQDLASRVDLRALEMSDEQQAAVEEIVAPEVQQISPESFDNIDDVLAWTDVANVVFADHVPEDLAEHAVEVWFDNWGEVQEAYGSMLDNEGDNLHSGFLDGLPVHPGAANVFEDRGVETDDWDVGSV